MSEKRNSILKKLQRYCSVQDRSVQKIREQLYDYNDLSDVEKEKIIGELLHDGYLDDERFTENYVRSKVNQNKWGRKKIIRGLHRHKIDEILIERGIEGIDHDRYYSNLTKLYEQKTYPGIEREKLIRFFVQKGYEYDEIISVIS